MAFKVWENSTQLGEFIVLVLLSPLGIAVTALRFIATRRGARRPGAEDWLAGLAALFFVLFNLSSLMAVSILNGREIVEVVLETPGDYKQMRKWDMCALYFFFGHSLTVKLSVLALYHRIFSVKRVYRVWIYILAAVQTILFIIFCAFQAVLCKPFAKYFDRSIPGTCKDDGLVILGGETPNSLVDFAMVILAMAMIRSLHLSSNIKWRLRFLFGLGALVGIIGFIKVAVTYSAAALYAFSLVAVLSTVQSFFALLCCCLPVFHPILPSAANWSRLSSRMLSYATFGWVSRDRSTARHTTERSSKRSGSASPPDRHRQGWEHLEDGSATQLAWPSATHHVETHALSDFQGAHTQSPGIQVQRSVDMV